MIPAFRRDSNEIVGAARASMIELISLEQMPGGRFQLTAKVGTGDSVFITPIIQDFQWAMRTLEQMRRYLGGEGALPDVLETPTEPPAL